MHVADVPLSMQALESYVKDESAPDAQALSKALFGDDINYFWHDATRVHTALQEVRASCPSSVQGVGVVCSLIPAGGLQAERGTDGGLLFPRGVPLFLVVTGVCFCVSGNVGLVGGWGSRAEVRAVRRGEARPLSLPDEMRRFHLLLLLHR